MTLYMLFATAGIVIYTGATFIAAISGVNDVRVAAFASNRSPVVIVPSESARAQAVDETPIQEPGCVQPDGDSQ